MQELKIRITNPKGIEEKLKELGAKFLQEIIFTDTYFNAPQGEVLKISQDSTGNYLIKLKENHGKFDAENMRAQFTSQTGIRRILKGRRRRFKYKDEFITLNLIDNLGQFLVITAQNPQNEFITQKLGIRNPEYISVPFSELQ